jgi:hypothetical protein
MIINRTPLYFLRFHRLYEQLALQVCCYHLPKEALNLLALRKPISGSLKHKGRLWSSLILLHSSIVSPAWYHSSSELSDLPHISHSVWQSSNGDDNSLIGAFRSQLMGTHSQLRGTLSTSNDLQELQSCAPLIVSAKL